MHVVMAAVGSSVTVMSRSEVSISPYSPFSPALTFFLPPLLQCSLRFGEGQGHYTDVPFMTGHPRVIYSQDLTT